MVNMSKIYDLYPAKKFVDNYYGPNISAACLPTVSKSKTCANGVCEKLRSSLSSLCCESAVVTLTLVSVLAISGEILVNYGILTTPSSQRGDDRTQDGQTKSGNTNESLPSSSNEEKDQTMDIVEMVFHYTSLVIAGIFFIEIVLKLFSLRMRFLGNPWQVLDMMIVLSAVSTEIAFEIEGRMIELEAVTYVVVLRLWRIPFACNIKAEAIQCDLEQEIEVWKAGNVKMEEKYRSLEAKNSKHKEKIERLERELTTAKKEAAERQLISKRLSDKQKAPPPPKSAMPYSKQNGFSSNHVPSPYHVITEDSGQQLSSLKKAESESDLSTVDGSPRRNPQRSRADETGRETEEDTLDEDEEERRKPTGGNYFRSGSESSLSCQALEHEVHVQIEGPEDKVDGVKGVVSSHGEPGGSAVNTPVQTRKKVQRKDDREHLVTNPVNTVYYDNGGYNPDLDNDDDNHAVLVHEFDGAKTYQSAEGIPMTDL